MKIPFRCDVVRTGKAVSFADVPDRAVCFHGIRMDFPFIRYFVNIGSVSDRHVFVFAPVHHDVFTHGVEGIGGGIVDHGAACQCVKIQRSQLGSYG